MKEEVGKLQRKEEKWGEKKEMEEREKPRCERRCGKNKRGKFLLSENQNQKKKKNILEF